MGGNILSMANGIHKVICAHSTNHVLPHHLALALLVSAGSSSAMDGYTDRLLVIGHRGTVYMLHVFQLGYRLTQMNAFVVIVLLVRLLDSTILLWLRGHLWWGVASVFLTVCLQALLALYVHHEVQ